MRKEAVFTLKLELADHPHSGRPGRVKDTRELVIGEAPSVIACRAECDSGTDTGQPSRLLFTGSEGLERRDRADATAWICAGTVMQP
jgi:hypothetical protein